MKFIAWLLLVRFGRKRREIDEILQNEGAEEDRRTLLSIGGVKLKLNNKNTYITN